MRKYVPEILLGIILSLTAALVLQAAPRTAAQTGLADAAPQQQVLAAVPEPQVCACAEPASFDGVYSLRLLRGGVVQELSLHDYLIGVIMSELSMDFAPEAMQAQAIASRTFALHCAKHTEADVCGDSGCCQAWKSDAELRERCGQAYEEFYDQARQAVEKTDGCVLTYNDALIDAPFFSCSGGCTEDAASVWGGEVPYLHSVESPGEEAAACFHSVVTVSAAEFAAQITSEAPQAALKDSPESWVADISRTSGGGVDTAVIGGAALRGTELRRIFGLKSTFFTIEYCDGSFTFDTYGYGHRVGMSQYGAQAMAQAGAAAAEILQAYYSGVQLVQLEAE